MKTIIAATDFSAAADNALHYAAEMALAIHADLLLFNSYEIPVAGIVPVSLDLDDWQQKSEELLNKSREMLEMKTGSVVKIKIIVKMGPFFQTLREICESVKPYTVVMGSQGKTAAERFLFGSHTVYAMKHLEWPLVTVSPTATFSGIQKIGLACDYENVADTVPFDEIKALVRDFNASLHIINTGKWDVFNPDIPLGNSTLKSLFAEIKPECHLLYNENTDETIIQFAEKNHIDLLVIIPKHVRLIDSVLHRSHTKHLVMNSRIPVMAMHHQKS